MKNGKIGSPHDLEDCPDCQKLMKQKGHGCPIWEKEMQNTIDDDLEIYDGEDDYI